MTTPLRSYYEKQIARIRREMSATDDPACVRAMCIILARLGESAVGQIRNPPADLEPCAVGSCSRCGADPAHRVIPHGPLLCEPCAERFDHTRLDR